MWSYYGRKTKVVKYYPKPVHGTIIEPFAGTAVYSLYEDNWQNEVVLVDKYSKIIQIWHYLQNASKSDILGLPDVGTQVDISKLSVSAVERNLIYYCSNRGSAKPYNVTGKWNSWAKNKIKIANSLHKIEHWSIIQGDYRALANRKATWFIDPPYQFGGHRYEHGNKNFDFEALAKWSKGRLGQVIVCENTKADWLPFKPLKSMRGNKHTTTEAIYVN